jgi:hypothetical protein
MICHPYRTLGAAVIGVACSLSAHAVVESGHWKVFNGSVGTYGDNVAIAVDQTASGDYTGSFFNYDAANGTLKLVSWNIDEGSELVLAQPGDIANSSFFPSTWTYPSTAMVPVYVGQDFYLAVATSSLSDPGVTWDNFRNRTSFGWAHFRTDAEGKLTIVDSAMAFREPGIIVGTLTTPVPEPATWAFMSMGLLGVGLARNRRQSR